MGAALTGSESGLGSAGIFPHRHRVLQALQSVRRTHQKGRQRIHLWQAIEAWMALRGLDVSSPRPRYRAVPSAPHKLFRTGDALAGVLMIDVRTGGYVFVQAKAVLLATGGGPTMYKFHTPSGEKSCDGLSMALDAGLALRDMEMVQFHPTGLLAGTGTRIPGRCSRRAYAGREAIYSMARVSALCTATIHWANERRATSFHAAFFRRCEPDGPARTAASTSK